MFGVTWRAAGVAVFSAVLSAIFLRVLDPIVEQMQHPTHWLVTSFTVLSENVLLISVLSAMLMWLIASIGGRAAAGRGQMKRIAYAYGVTLGMAVAALIYFRFGLVLIELGTNEHAGMFSPVSVLLEVIVPVVIAIVVAVTWLWVLVSPWQIEQRRRQQPTPVVRGPR